MKHLFLDLEDTVITPVWNGWQDTELINIQLVRDLIEFEKPDQVSIFSFAIHNQKERAEFVKHVRGRLEAALEVVICNIPMVDEHIIPACARTMGIHPETVSFNDACEFWSKHQAFRLYVKDSFRLVRQTWRTATEVILLDDMVFNETWHWPDLRIAGKLIRVQN